MRWKDGRRSKNIVDRRGSTMRRGATVGGGGAIVLVLLALFLGADPSVILQQVGGGGAGGGGAQRAPAPGEDQAAEFVSVVLADTEDTWQAIFSTAGASYREPRLLLYRDSVQSACGFGSAAAGPFYCPGDQMIYLDLSFLDELQRMGASGDFSVAYVIAHEVGHHVQTITGTSQKVREAQARAGERESNALQVMVELQADCYAGVWAHHAHRQRKVLESGDIEEALGAAAAVGDDTLQRSAGRRVQPESFTHGSAEQRMRWFRTGLETGDTNACDTFGG